MPLDPYLAETLAVIARNTPEADPAASPEAILHQARADYRILTRATLSPDQIGPVGAVEDITVEGAAGPLAARVFRPERQGPVPTIAFFHGGGWVIGDLDTHDNMCRDLCRASGAVVVSVAYRLAPEHPFPAGVEDAIAATRWVFANAARLGGSDRVGVAGDSAGGNLSAVVAQALRGSGLRLAGQFLIYPATDHIAAGHPSMTENATGYFLEEAQMQWFYANYLGDWSETRDPRLAPMQAEDLTGLPPALIVTAEFDPLRDEGEAYGAALAKAGNVVETRRVDGMIHGFFDMGRWSPAAQAAITSCSDHFGKMLRG